MKSLKEIQATLPPKTKFFFPRDDCGITRIKLNATKHTRKIRIVFSWFDGVDVVTAAYRQWFITQDEVDELKRLFFTDEERDACVVMAHPGDKYAVIICRVQEGVVDGL